MSKGKCGYIFGIGLHIQSSDSMFNGLINIDKRYISQVFQIRIGMLLLELFL